MGNLCFRPIPLEQDRSLDGPHPHGERSLLDLSATDCGRGVEEGGAGMSIHEYSCIFDK